MVISKILRDNLRPISIKNAQVWRGVAFASDDLHFAERILSTSAHNALEIDLAGYKIFPALVNAHDHLELNHFPRTKFRERYNNAHQWGEDVSAKLNESPFKELREYSLEDRCFIGGLKNLLSGATTVIHHNPPHKVLFRRGFPVRVFKNYGWAHSLHFSTNAEIRESYRKTPEDGLWFIHLAEGTDEIAKSEYGRIKALGCIGNNTVLIHGVGLSEDDIAECAPIIKGLVICPTTNHYLLDALPNIKCWIQHGGKLFIGSDSRLTANGDMIDEIMFLAQHDFFALQGDNLLDANTLTSTYQLINGDLPFAVGSHADFIVQPDWCKRSGHGMIVKDGVPQIGDPELMALFPHIDTIQATLDGMTKSINIHLARQIARCTLREPGLELLEEPHRKRFMIF